MAALCSCACVFSLIPLFQFGSLSFRSCFLPLAFLDLSSLTPFFSLLCERTMCVVRWVPEKNKPPTPVKKEEGVRGGNGGVV